MKRTICVIICLTLALFTLCACDSTYENSFIKHNYERDYRQPIVTIAPITDNSEMSGKRVKYDEDGATEETEDWSYTSPLVTIYKSQLVSYINNYASTFVNNYGMSYDDAVDYFIEQLITAELVTIEADIKFENHEIFWTKDDIDSIQHSVYDSLDAALNEIVNEILEEHGREAFTSSEEQEEESGSTTYPVKTVEEPEKERVFYTFGSGKDGKNNLHDSWYLDDEWYIAAPENFASLPGNYGSADTKSLFREGVRRLVTSLGDRADTLINLTDEERATIKKEVEDLRAIIKESGEAYAYMALGRTLMVKKLYGDAAIRSQKMTILQDAIESGVSVSDEEVERKYQRMLKDQTSSFADAGKYDTAATGTDLVLYRPNSDYLYVKHILIPFSDAQKEFLTNYKKNNTNAAYLAERQRQVSNIVAYRHVDGEDDTSRPLTVDEIWSDVRAIMSRASADPFTAERTFDDLIYLYNTDPGIFNNEAGYAVKYKLAAGESETYMTEFAETARAFRDEHYKVGQIYNKYIVTDYGVHIMYYAADYEAGHVLSLNDYTTPGRYTLVKDEIRQGLLETATQNEYTRWQKERINHYRNEDGIVKMLKKAYKDLYA